MNKIIQVLQRLFSLLVVFLMLGAAAVTSGSIFGHNLNPQYDSDEQKTSSIIEPDALVKRKLEISDASFEVRDSSSWYATSMSGQPLGIVLSSESVGAEIEGFAGKTPVYILIGTDDRIVKMAMGQNDETPFFLIKAVKSIFPSWYGVKASEALDVELDAVTGATYSSNAIIGNMKKAISAYNNSDLKIGHAPAIGWVKTIAIFLMLAAGIVVSFKLRGKKWVRLVMLSLNVLVIGFWCGQFLSMSILKGWVTNGFNFINVLPTFVLLLVALLMPYFGHRNHFCMWVCPYGSLQELVWHIPLKKIKLKPSVLKWMGRVRTLVFITLMALLWLGWGSVLLDYEPFGAFLFEAAAPVVLILASFFVLLAIFIPRPWCKTFCPVGEILHLAETPLFEKKTNHVKILENRK